MATPIVAPTWRSAEIRADPDPLRSADSWLSATFIAGGMASPRPRPAIVIHAAAYPVELATFVNAPITMATAMIANPPAMRTRALTRAGATSPELSLRGDDSRAPA